MNRVWLTAIACALLAACGGGGGSGGGFGDADFLTADTQGWFAGGAPGALPADGAEDVEDGIQRAVEEADLVRVDGDLLYALNSWRGLAVVDLAAPALLGRLEMRGWPLEAYLRPGRALVLLNDFEGGGAVVDVSVADPSAPVESARAALPEAVHASRLVGDVLYVVTDAHVLSFDLAGPVAAATDSVDLPGGAWFVHATDRFLFVASPDPFGDTLVTVVDVSDPAGDVAVRGSISLPGFVADDTKLHFGAGTLRVVTHDWLDARLSRLFTVDLADPDAPAVLGQLDIVRDEMLFGTLFTDDTAYVVTFEVVDPLWVVDLRDPAAPTVAGSLVTDGWSTQLAAVGTRLVALGYDPAGGRTTVSLFDVSDPAAPTLLDREDVGSGFSPADWDRRGFGVFEDDSLVLVPFRSDRDELVVLGLGATTLTVRGSIEASGTVLRGLPHPRGLVAVSTEEVVRADPATLAVTGRVTLAEDVVDAARLPDGTLLSLVRHSQGATCGPVALALWPDRMHPYGTTVAVTGWDDLGAAAYVIDFASDPPAVSARIGLGGGGGSPGPEPLGDPSVGGMPGAYGWGSTSAILTEDGDLVVHGLPEGASDLDVGSGEPQDGFTVLSLGSPSAPLRGRIRTLGAYVTGLAASGGDLVFTLGQGWGADPSGRPLLRHDFARVDLATLALEEEANVPGWVVAASGDLVFTVEETWDDGWAYGTAVVASRVAAGEAEVASRLVLPAGAFDLRAAGNTLWFTAWTGGFDFGDGTVGGGGGGGVRGTGPGAGADWGDGALPPSPDGFWSPETTLGTVRLGATLALGPSIESEAYLSLLLPEDGSALVVANGVVVERWDVSGATAAKAWSADVGAWPSSARPDTAPGRYLLALGYGGLVVVP